MKKFISQIILFFFLFVVYIHVVAFLLFYSKKYQANVLGNEVYFSIAKSKKKNKSKKLIIGDSVGKQLFENKVINDTINSFACNQGISMAGHFILLNNYINAGNQIDTVFFIFTPFSFRNNLDEIYTFQYFLKPFYNDEYMPYFSKTVLKQIEDIPYYKLCRYPPITTTNWSPDFTEKDMSGSYTFLSPISVEYLKKIKNLALQNNFKLIFLPAPTRISRKIEVQNLNKNEISGTGLEEEFKGFFDKIVYLDDNNFFDIVHLKNPAPYTEYYKNNFIK